MRISDRRRDLDQLATDYRKDGYCVLAGALTPLELGLLQEETAAQITAGPDRSPAADFVVRRTTDGGELFYRIQTLHDRPLVNRSVLWLLAQPLVLALVARLIPDPVCYGNAMVFKGEQGGPPIDVHRDGLPTADGHVPDVVSVDVYLDRATPETGCLGVAPGSHLRRDVTADVARGFDLPLVDVVLEPGDVLLHDGMLIHGSRPTPPGRPLRRVIYPTFQPAGQVVERGGIYPLMPVPERFVAECLALQLAAAESRRTEAPYDDADEFQLPLSDHWLAAAQQAGAGKGDPTTWRPIAGGLPWETGQMRQHSLDAPPVDLAALV